MLMDDSPRVLHGLTVTVSVWLLLRASSSGVPPQRSTGLWLAPAPSTRNLTMFRRPSLAAQFEVIRAI